LGYENLDIMTNCVTILVMAVMADKLKAARACTGDGQVDAQQS